MFAWLEFAAAFQGAGHGDFVGVFYVAASWNAGGNASDLDRVAVFAGMSAGVQG